MNLSVLFSLILDVALDDFFIRILTNCVHVKATGPEITSPENFLDLRVRLEDMLGREALGNLCDLAWRKNRDTLNEKMHMIQICSDLDETDFIASLDTETHVFKRSLDRFSKSFFPVFHRTNQVIQKQCSVVALGDVFTHPKMLHLREPTPHSECEVFRNERMPPQTLHFSKMSDAEVAKIRVCECISADVQFTYDEAG